VDAIVVGGGPAGSTAAWRLARCGCRVAVFDAARFPRVKLCAGWVTPACLADLEIDPASYPHTIQPFAAASLELDEAIYETQWPRPVGYGIVRAEFDTFLLRRAEAAGAEVHEGVRVRGMRIEPAGVVLETEGGTVRAPLVIGAGGSTCPVARACRQAAGRDPLVVTQESETRIGAEVLRQLTARYGTPELVPEPDFHGYGWYFTKGDFLNIGVGTAGDGPSVHRRLERLCARLRQSGRLPATLRLTPFRGHAYAVRRTRPPALVDGRVLLVGDAAGLARDLSGEGIGPAVRSGCVAAEVVLAGALDDYPRRLETALGTPSALVAALGQYVPETVLVRGARLACTVPWLRRRLVFEGAFGMG